MGPLPLVPSTEAIPAPAWLFHTLDVLFFLIHILLINVILGGSILLLARRLRHTTGQDSNTSVLSTKLPVLFALAINMGVAPLLFMQVIFGHLFYTSSVLMGVYWILVIPLVIIAYYGTYVQAKGKSETLKTNALALTTAILLYIGFAFTNNLLMMMQPERWTGYFFNRGGTMLDAADPTFIPRYLHFVIASIAVAALASALVWEYRRKHGVENAATRTAGALKIFGVATIAQIAAGLWFLLSLNRDMMMQFMGGDILATVIFMVAFLSGIGAVATSFSGKFRPTLIQAAITVVLMVLTRDQLRSMYLNGVFDPSSLQLAPQYGVLALFVVILLLGVGSVVWMLRAGFKGTSGRAAQ
jgi:hypothetical protein